MNMKLRDKLGIRSIRAAIECRLPSAVYSALYRRRFLSDVVVDIRKLDTFEMEAFPDSGPAPWLDRPDALSRIDSRVRNREITPETADSYRQWHSEGYLILESLIDYAELDSIWRAYENAIDDPQVSVTTDRTSADDPHPGRTLSPHLQVPEIAALLNHPQICGWVRSLTGHEPIPYQTIASSAGSEQKVHSDSVHMTTYPPGYMVAAWIAFEDISEDSGPVVYYPGSHRLPYVSSRSVGITEKKSDYVEYQRKYEPAIHDLIQKEELQPRYLTAKKGDVLLWHANLLHGGSSRKNLKLSRRAVVCHYFVKGAVSYHDLTGRQTFLDSNRVL